jgi:hypothetical protein
MKPSAVILGIILILGASITLAQTAPTVPAWVRPGLIVAYDGLSAFVNNGRFTQGIQVLMTSRVTSVSENNVAASTQVQTVGTPLLSTHAWVCNAAGNCKTDATGFSLKFWVDPDDPTSSARGAHGEPYTVVGKGPYTYAGRTWAATTMSYQNKDTGWQLMITFETKTGLVLAYSEVSPGQQVHIYFRSMR